MLCWWPECFYEPVSLIQKQYTSALQLSVEQCWVSQRAAAHCREFMLHWNQLTTTDKRILFDTVFLILQNQSIWPITCPFCIEEYKVLSKVIFFFRVLIRYQKKFNLRKGYWRIKKKRNVWNWKLLKLWNIILHEPYI